MLSFNMISPVNEIVHSYSPTFNFQLLSNVGDVQFVLEVSDTPDFTGVVHEYSQLTRGIRPYLLLHCDGSEGSTSFADSSPYSHSLINRDNKMIKTQVTKVFGSASGLAAYDVGSSLLQLQQQADFDLGLGAFTLEGYFKTHRYVSPIARDTRLFEKIALVSGLLHGYNIVILEDSRPRFELWENGVKRILMTGPDSLNDTWRHIAIVGYDKPNRPIAMFVEGKKIGEQNGDYNIIVPSYLRLNICGWDYESSWMDEFRMVKYARYDDDFEPYDSPFFNNYFPIGNISDWQAPYYSPFDPVLFSPPADNLISDSGKWYWRVKVYPYKFVDVLIGESRVYSFTIDGATRPWRVGTAGQEIEFIPSNQTVVEEIVRSGRRQIIKRKFTVDFAHMKKEKRDALYAEFALKTSLRFHDNMGNAYWVYWGDVSVRERTLNGTAHAPNKPIFGIDRSNMIAGALRYSGTAVFSEV